MNKILVIDPNKMDEIKLLNEFNDDNVVTSKENQKKKTTMSEKEYQELQRKSNVIEYQIVIEHGNKEKEICYIHGEKDIKQCHISFDSKNNNVSKKILNAGIDYAFDIGMETIFINVEKDNQKLIKLLETNNFINIGEVKGKDTYLIEKEEKDIGSKTNENNKKH